MRPLAIQKYFSGQAGLSVEDMSKYTVDLVDEFFPKGECKERGKAIVLHAKMLIALHEAINKGKG